MPSQRHGGRSLPALAPLILVVASCGPGLSPTPPPASSPQASPSPTPLIPTPVPSPVALDAVTPTSSVVVARVEVGSDIGAPELALALYADGSLVDLRSRPPTVFRLSPSGLDTIVQRLRGSGLFGESHAIPAPDVPMGFGLFVVTFVDNGSPVRVNGTNVGTDPESRALTTLVEGFLDPLAWLPQAGFVDGDRLAHPYRAAATRVTSETVALGPADWTNAAQALDRVAWPLAVPASELGDPMPIAGHPERALRCGLISGGDEAAIRAALAAFRAEDLDPGARTTGWYAWLSGPSLLRLTLHPFLPDEATGCPAADMPTPPSLAEAPRPSLHALLAASAGGLTPGGTGPTLFAQIIGSDGPTVAHVSYYADGTILFYDAPAPAVGIGARRLTATGVAEVQRALDASGLLRGDYSEAIPDGAADYHTFSLVAGGTVLNGSDRHADPKATAIAALVTKLVDPMSWLAADAWVGGSTAIHPYAPSSIRLTIGRPAGPFDPWLPTMGDLRWPLAGSIVTFGEPVEGSPFDRSAIITVDDALALMRELELRGARPDGALTHAEYRLADPRASMTVSFSFGIESDEWGP